MRLVDRESSSKSGIDGGMRTATQASVMFDYPSIMCRRYASFSNLLLALRALPQGACAPSSNYVVKRLIHLGRATGASADEALLESYEPERDPVDPAISSVEARELDPFELYPSTNSGPVV
jgi:hypothetical protein